MARKEPRITQDPFSFSPFTVTDMMDLGQFMSNTKASRIQSGRNSLDQQAHPLTPRYARRKVKMGLQGIRDWTYRGKTMRSMGVKRVSNDQVVVGFTDDQANTIAWHQNLREPMFEASPQDRLAMEGFLRGMSQRHRLITLHGKLAS